MQKIPVQHIWKERQQGTTENSHTGHCAYALGNSYVKVQNIQHEN